MTKKTVRSKGQSTLKKTAQQNQVDIQNGYDVSGKSTEQFIKNVIAKQQHYTERFRSLMGDHAQFLWNVGADGIVEDDSPTWRAFTGQSIDEVRGMGWLDALHPADRKRVIEAWGSNLDSQDFFEMEILVRRYDGIYRTLLSRGYPNYKPDGTLRGLTGVCIDITERKQLEEKLRQSEQRFRSTFEQAQVGIAHIDPGGRWLLINQKLSDITGYTHEELSQLSFHAIIPPAEVGSDNVLVQSLLQGERQSYTKEKQYVHKNGSFIWVNQTVNLIRDETGKPLYFIAIIEDITERKRVEQRKHVVLNTLLTMAELLVLTPAESETDTLPADPPEEGSARQLAKLTCQVLDCRSVGLLTLEPQTGVLLPIATAGISTEHKQRWWTTQLQERNLLSTSFSAEQIGLLQNNEALLLQTEQAQLYSLLAPYPTRMMLVAPMIITNQLIGLLILDHGDTEHAYPSEDLALARAIARLAGLVIERKRLQDERAAAQAGELAQRAANQRMEEFLSIASHELRSPLTTISVYTQIADRILKKLAVGDDTDDLVQKKEAVRDILHNAMRQVDMLNRLVSDLIDISRIQANKLELHMRMKPCDLTTIVQEAVQNQQRITSGRAIHLSMKGTQAHSATHLMPIGKHETLLPLYADADRIGQVVTNYITNALKYAAEDQPIEVRLYIEDDQARVSVRDRGPGLSGEEQRHVWERFYQVKRIESHNVPGTGLGLGLYISRSIIERHNGEVGVESEPGEGSTFWFTLPLAKNDELPQV